MKVDGTVYVLLSKHKGSNFQNIELAKELADGVRSVIGIKCELRSRKKVFFFFYRILLLITNHSFLRFIRKVILVGDYPLMLKDKDLVVAKTPPFEVPLLLLTKGTGAKTFFIGKPKRMKASSFQYLLSTPSTPVPFANINLSMLPSRTQMKKYDVTKNRETNISECWCILVGGNTSGFDYTVSVWEEFCRRVVFLSKHHNITFLISTSPRTGAIGEKVMKKMLKVESGVEKLFLWSENRDSASNPMLEFIECSDVVLVTEDSAAMISDSLVNGRPTISVRISNESYNSLSSPLAVHHCEKGHLFRTTIDNLDNVDFKRWRDSCYRPLKKCWREELRSQLDFETL